MLRGLGFLFRDVKLQENEENAQLLSALAENKSTFYQYQKSTKYFEDFHRLINILECFSEPKKNMVSCK